MDSLWKKLTELYPEDHVLTRIIHSRLYRDGQSCEKRRRAALKLLHAGWSVKHVAEALGRPTAWVFRLAKTTGSGTTGSSDTQTKPITRVIIPSPFQVNYSGSMENKETK